MLCCVLNERSSQMIVLPVSRTFLHFNTPLRSVQIPRVDSSAHKESYIILHRGRELSHMFRREKWLGCTPQTASNIICFSSEREMRKACCNQPGSSWHYWMLFYWGPQVWSKHTVLEQNSINSLLIEIITFSCLMLITIPIWDLHSLQVVILIWYRLFLLFTFVWMHFKSKMAPHFHDSVLCK